MSFSIRTVLSGLFAGLLAVASLEAATSVAADTPLDVRLLRLTSAPGELERYERVKPGEPGAPTLKRAEETLAPGTRIVRSTVSNPSDKPLLVKLATRAAVPLERFAWWNGYANQDAAKFEGDTLLTQWFPVNAAIGGGRAFLIGVHPGEVYSRVLSRLDSSSKMLELEFPLVLDPGASRTVSVVVSTCAARYGQRDVVQHYYDLFPEWFAPAKGIHPAVTSTQSTYLFWKPQGYQQPVSPDLIRRLTNGAGGWEWCYKPFVRGGDWAITDKWSLGYQGATAESLEAVREDNRRRFGDAAKAGVAPMYYLNIFWSEQTLMKEHFPEALANPTFDLVCWGGVALRGLYPWKNAYGDLFVESIRTIAESFPTSRGIGWDSTFGHGKVPATVAGVNETVEKSYDNKGEIFALNGAAYTHLLDLNRSLVSDGYRRANAVNLKLVAPWFIGVRSDTALYEGTPVENPSRLVRFEALRARYGSPKVLSWHKHLIPSRLKWIKWDKLTVEEGREAYRQVQDDTLFLSYYWSAVPSPGVPTLGIRRTFEAVPELIELARLGWRPSPGVDCQKPFLLARYGTGTDSKIVVINPEFGASTAELFFPAAYWGGKLPLLVRRDGQALEQTLTPEGVRLSLPTAARSVTILEASGEVNAPRSDVLLTTSAQTPAGASGAWRLQFGGKAAPSFRFAVPPGYQAPEAAGAVASGRTLAVTGSGDVTITARPLIASEKDAAGLREWFADHPAAEVAEGAEAVADAAAPVRGWFAAYREIHPEAAPVVSRKIVLAITPGAAANIAVRDDTLTLSAGNAEELAAATGFFLRQMDLAYPYCGVIPPSKKDAEMTRLELPGTVLEPAPQSAFVLRPTLSERMEKAFKPLAEE